MKYFWHTFSEFALQFGIIFCNLDPNGGSVYLTVYNYITDCINNNNKKQNNKTKFIDHKYK